MWELCFLFSRYWSVLTKGGSIIILEINTLSKSFDMTSHKELLNSSINFVDLRFPSTGTRPKTDPKESTNITDRFALVKTVGLPLLGRYSPQTDRVILSNNYLGFVEENNLLSLFRFPFSLHHKIGDICSLY